MAVASYNDPPNITPPNIKYSHSVVYFKILGIVIGEGIRMLPGSNLGIVGT